jgi:hypothetical protein
MLAVRALRRISTGPVGGEDGRPRGHMVDRYVYATDDAAATVEAPGYFNFARARLHVGDGILVVAAHAGAPVLKSLVVTGMPVGGDVTVALQDAGVAPIPYEDRWIAPTAQGDGSGSSAANARASLFQIPAMQAQAMAAANGKIIRINVRNDLGEYSILGGSNGVFLGPGYPGKGNTRTIIRSCDANGVEGAPIRINGGRGAPPRTDQSGSFGFRLSQGCDNITIRGFRFDNFRSAIAFVPSVAVGAPAQVVYDLEIENCPGSNYYRYIQCDWTPNFENPGKARIDGLRVINCPGDWTAQNLLTLRNCRDVEVIDSSSDGRSVNQLGNNPAGIAAIPSFVEDNPPSPPPGDTTNDIRVFGFFSRAHIMAPPSGFAQGDGGDLDDDSVGNINQGQFWDMGTTLHPDGGWDRKTQGIPWRRTVSWNNNIGIKDWTRSGRVTPTFDEAVINPCTVPGTEGSDPKRRHHYFLLMTGATYEHTRPQWYHWTTVAAAKMPPVACQKSWVPAPGTDILPSSAQEIFYGSESKTNQTLRIFDWRWINVQAGTPLFRREGQSNLHWLTDITIEVSPAWPQLTIGTTWRPGFQGGAAADGTPAGTDVLTLTHAHDQAEGTAFWSILSDPDDKFEIVEVAGERRLRLKSGLAVGVDADHPVELQAVYGILGTGPYRNPAQPWTWQCHMGLTVGPLPGDATQGNPVAYRRRALTLMVIGNQDADATAFIAAGVAAGLDGSVITPGVEAQIDRLIKALKAGGSWATADEQPYMEGPTPQWSLRGLKRNHNAVIEGNVAWTAGGGFQGDGAPGSRILWPSFVGNAAGQNFQRDAAAVSLDILQADNVETTSCLVAGNFSGFRMVARATATQATLRVNTGSDTNATVSAVGRHLLRRTTSTAWAYRRNGLAVTSGTQASVAQTASPLSMLGTTAAGTTLRMKLTYVGGILTDAADAASAAAYASARQILVNQLLA